MKRFLPLAMLTLALMLSGCAWVGRHLPWHHSSPATPAATATAQPEKAHPAKSKNIVTADESLIAKVLTVNTVGQFVVLNYPAGHLPKLDQHLFLYRNGLKTAEVKVVGPQQDTCIVADILSGDAQAGDTVRDQ
jgi:hypothetical protein